MIHFTPVTPTQRTEQFGRVGSGRVGSGGMNMAMSVHMRRPKFRPTCWHVSCEYAIAPYFARCRSFRIFQQSAHIAYFSASIGIFDGNFNIIWVSISYFYYVSLALDHLVANMCRDPCGTRCGSCFEAISNHISTYFRRIFGVYAIRIFLNKNAA